MRPTAGDTAFSVKGLYRTHLSEFLMPVVAD